MGYQERIVRNPQIVGGEPVFMETRVTLKTVLLSLAEGAANAEILADFPTLSEEDVRAAIAVAGASTPDNTCSDVKGSGKGWTIFPKEQKSSFCLSIQETGSMTTIVRRSRRHCSSLSKTGRPAG